MPSVPRRDAHALAGGLSGQREAFGAVNSTVSPARTERAEWLMALGIATLGWLVGAGLLNMFAGAPGLGEAPEAGTAPLRVGDFIVPLVAGCLCQCAGAALDRKSRRRQTMALLAAWLALAVIAAVVPHRIGLREPWSILELVVQQAAFVLGVAGGWLCTPAFAQKLEKRSEALGSLIGPLMVAASAALILLPLAPDTALLHPAIAASVGSLAGYAKALPGQLYLALKPLILWVPVGMLYALVHRQVQLRIWTSAAALAFCAVGLALLYDRLVVGDVIEIVSAYWGILAGIWLGAQVDRTVPDAQHGGPAELAVSPGATAQRSDRGPSSRATTARVARRIVAVLLLLGVGVWAWLFPRWGMAVLCVLALYALLLARYRHAWLLVVPAALPLLNLAPGTGRFFFDEFDMVLATTVAMALWHGPSPEARPVLSRWLAIAFSLFGISIVASLVIGLLPLSPLDANAFTNYLSHYNSLRVAKGFLWVVPLLALMRWTLPAESPFAVRLFVSGMWLGLAGVIVAGLWERASFASLVDLTVPYRITATFSSMHTGGSEIETYLVTAIPLVWLAFAMEWPIAIRFAGVLLLALGAYLMTLTIARAGLLALGVALCVLLVGAWRSAAPKPKHKWVVVAAAIAFLAGAAVLGVGWRGGYLQKRLGHAEEDWAVRVDHWRTALAIRDHDLLTDVLGMGLGRFPDAYLFRSGASLPGTYAFIDEDGNRFLRLGGGETLYMAQRVAVIPGQRYVLSLRVRSRSADARLGVPLCEKQLLDSHRCQWQTIPVPGDDEWHAQSIAIDSGLVGAGNFLTRRPVELSLYDDTERSVIDVDDVQLRDRGGADLIRNGDFSAGGDDWFFKTHSHLPWHIKNLWVEVLFEQGWLGAVSLLLLVAAVVGQLAITVWRGNRFAGAWLASICGFLTVGLFGSLFDAPRIATLFFLLVILSGIIVGAPKRR